MATRPRSDMPPCYVDAGTCGVARRSLQGMSLPTDSRSCGEGQIQKRTAPMPNTEPATVASTTISCSRLSSVCSPGSADGLPVRRSYFRRMRSTWVGAPGTLTFTSLRFLSSLTTVFPTPAALRGTFFQAPRLLTRTLAVVGIASPVALARIVIR